MTRGAAVGKAVFRPVRARVIPYVLAAAVVATMTGLAIALPRGGPHPWGLESRLGVVAIGLAAALLIHRLAAVRVVATDEGVLVVNVVRRRQLEWAEIVGVRLLRDDAWMMLDLADGNALAAMGVQKSEGARAERQAESFARMVQEHTQVPGHE